MHEQRVFRAGNSLAIRIPSAIAKRAGLIAGTPVDMSVEHETIQVTRSASPRLHDLVDAITPENVHDETFAELGDRERW